jgi:hypothetical protein
MKFALNLYIHVLFFNLQISMLTLQKIVNHKFNCQTLSVNKGKTLQLSNAKFPYQNMPLMYINFSV